MRALRTQEPVGLNTQYTALYCAVDVIRVPLSIYLIARAFMHARSYFIMSQKENTLVQDAHKQVCLHACMETCLYEFLGKKAWKSWGSPEEVYNYA